MIALSDRAFVVMWEELDRWSVNSLFEVQWNWPAEMIKPLSKVLRRRIISVNRAEHRFDALQLVTLGFNGEMKPRDLKNKTDFKGNLFFAAPGDVVYSKIDVRNGAIGIVPESLGRIAVSSEFPVYEIAPEQALPEYVKFLFRSSHFRRVINSMVSGTSGRKRVQPDELESVKVPLPPVDMQRAIVAHWQRAQHTAAEIRAEGNKRLSELENLLLSKIGITLMPPTPRRGAFMLAWEDLERWDTFFYRYDFDDLQSQFDRLVQRGYRVENLGDVLNFITRSWKEQKKSETTFRYIEISSVNKTDGITGSREVAIKDAPSRATTFVQTGDVLIATTRPYLGAFTIVPKIYDGCVCSSGFALADGVKSEYANKEYVLLFLKSGAGLRQMERRMTGGLYPAIVQSELEKVQIPLPTLDVQAEIVRTVQGAREEITRKRRRADTLLADVRAEVEAMILGTRPAPVSEEENAP